MKQSHKHKEKQRKVAKYLPKLKKGTRHEKILMQRLKDEGIWFKHNTYFYDENVLFFPDFILKKQYGKLIIEVDGKSHLGRMVYDAERTAWLMENRNCEVIRFTNEEIENNLDGVIIAIRSHSPKSANEVLTGQYLGRFNHNSLPVDENGMYIL